MAQIPHGPKHLKCPLWKKAMSTCCHACPLWVQVRGANAQGEELPDEWNCALTILPWAMLRAAQESFQAAASSDKVATAVDESGKQTAKEIALLHESIKQANILNSTILLGESVGGRVLITADKGV